MNAPELSKRIAAYFVLNLSMLPITAGMTTNFLIKNYLNESEKKELSPEDLPNFGDWLSRRFIEQGLFEAKLISRLVADFRKSNV